MPARLRGASARRAPGQWARNGFHGGESPVPHSSPPYTNETRVRSLGIRKMMRSEDFERLYEAHAASLLAFLEYRTGNIELARDVHADTFERILKTRWRFDARKGSQKTWVYAIALNVLRDAGRRRAAEPRAYDRVAAGPGDEHWDESTRLDDRDAIRRGLSTLPDDEREA